MTDQYVKQIERLQTENWQLKRWRAYWRLREQQEIINTLLVVPMQKRLFEKMKEAYPELFSEHQP